MQYRVIFGLQNRQLAWQKKSCRATVIMQLLFTGADYGTVFCVKTFLLISQEILPN